MKALLGVHEGGAREATDAPHPLSPCSRLLCGDITDRFQSDMPLMGLCEIQCTRPQCFFSAMNHNVNV